jgi:transcription elongation factor GreA
MTTWLSQDAYDRLKVEYEELSTVRRSEVVNKIAAAREEGDLKENGGYHAAREEQGKLEARIKQLRQLLESAQVGPPPAADGTVQVGHEVSVTFVGGALDGVSCAYVAFDADVLEPSELAVFMPEPGGISLADAERILAGIAAGTNVLGAGFTGATFEPGNVPPLARLAAALEL